MVGDKREILAVMGRSGRYCACLAHMLAPAEGEVWFDGDHIDIESDEARCAATGSSSCSSISRCPSSRLRRTSLSLLLGGVPAANLWLRHGPGSAAMGLDRSGERRRSGGLSGGEAQRVALARLGLVGRPGAVR